MTNVLDLVIRETLSIRSKQSGDIGIELEIEGENLGVFQTPPGWMVKEEPSLRNGGFELVTRGAVSREKLEKQLLAAQESLRNPIVVIPSGRTSTHIHVNFQNDAWRTAMYYIIGYVVVEPVLMRICGPARHGNLFFLASYQTSDLP